jgi:hypothetical protein
MLEVSFWSWTDEVEEIDGMVGRSSSILNSVGGLILFTMFYLSYFYSMFFGVLLLDLGGYLENLALLLIWILMDGELL